MLKSREMEPLSKAIESAVMAVSSNSASSSSSSSSATSDNSDRSHSGELKSDLVDTFLNLERLDTNLYRFVLALIWKFFLKSINLSLNEVACSSLTVKFVS